MERFPILQSLYLSTEVVQRAVVAQERVIKKIAQEGSCVIVGRAADYVLEGHPNVLRVFVYAPEEDKIERIMKIYGDTREGAKKHIRRADEARALYYKRISGRAWGERGSYDMIINSAQGLEESAEMICAQVRAMESNKN